MKNIYIGKDILIKALFVITVFMSVFPNILVFYVTPLYILMLKLATPIFVIGALLFLTGKLYKNKLVMIWIAIYAGMNVITYIDTGQIDYFDNITVTLSLVLICSYMCEYDSKFFIRFLMLYFTVQLVLNTLMWRPGGTFVNGYGLKSYVIGTKTTITYYQIAACLFAVIYIKTEISKAKKAIVCLSLLLSIVVYDIVEPISTSIICIIAFVAMIILDTVAVDISKVILRYGYFGVTILNIAVSVFRIQYLFKYLLVDVLGEGLTLDGRTLIWDEIFTYVVQRPLVGYGLNSGITFINNINTSAHNQVIHWVFTFGIIGAVVMVVFGSWISSRYSLDDIRGRIARLIMINLALYWMAEQMMTNYIFIMMTVALFNLDKYEISDNTNALAKYFYKGKNE